MLDPSDEDVSQERSAVHESDFRRQCRMELDLHLSDFSDDDTEPPDIGIPLSVLEKAGYQIDLDIIREKGWMKYDYAPDAIMNSVPQSSEPEPGNSLLHLSKPQFRSDQGKGRRPYFEDKKMRKEREERRLRNRTCDMCSKVFAYRRSMMAHRKKHAGPRIPCTYDNCNKLFMRKQSLLEHTRAIHLKATFDCPICGEKFLWRGLFRDHKKKHEQSGST